MIVSRDINPERDFYYLGARVISILSEGNISDFLEVRDRLVEQGVKLPLSLYILTLDWLYMIGLVKLSENGELQKCF
jgi:hypothetical protein